MKFKSNIKKRTAPRRCAGAAGSPPAVPDAFGIFLNGNLQMVELAQPGHKTPAIYMTFEAAQHHCRDDEEIVPICIDRADGNKAETIDRMVDRFLCWPLPESVCPDGCVMDRKYPHRVGTNLLTAIEAKQMFEHVLANNPAQTPEGRSPGGCL